MNVLTWILVGVVILLALGAAPSAGIWNHNYGYWPSGGLITVLVVVLVILLLTGRL